MKRNLLLLFFLLLYSCGGGNSPTQPPSINYYTADQTFIDDLVEMNEISIEDITDNRMAKVEIDSGSISYYKIKKLLTLV